jgi:Leucine-rich repeat (LRR) protein
VTDVEQSSNQKADTDQPTNHNTGPKKKYKITIKGKEINLGQLNIPEIEQLCQQCTEPHAIEKVTLCQTSLTYIPGSLQRFRNLCYLNFSNNKIKFVSCHLAELKKLKVLDLSHNDIEDVPISVCLITSLRLLNLEHNHIEYLPTGLLELKHLKELDLGGNPVLAPPPLICEMGVEAIFSALRDQERKTDLLHNWTPYYSAEKITLMPLLKICVETILRHRIDYNSMDTIPTSIKKYLTLTKTSNATRLPPLQKCGTCLGYFSKRHLFLNHKCKANLSGTGSNPSRGQTT